MRSVIFRLCAAFNIIASSTSTIIELWRVHVKQGFRPAVKGQPILEVTYHGTGCLKADHNARNSFVEFAEYLMIMIHPKAKGNRFICIGSTYNIFRS